MNGWDTEEEEAERARSRNTPDQGGSTYWDYKGLSRDDPRVQEDKERGRRAARDQGGLSWYDYERARRGQ